MVDVKSYLRKDKLIDYKTIVDSSREGKFFVYKNKKYRVGRMSYGDYFLEPYEKSIGKGEKDPFVRGTLWLEKVRQLNQYNYPQEYFKVI